MKFGPVPLDEARGAIMAHSQRVGERMIRKGSVLDEDALDALARSGPRGGHRRPPGTRRRARGHRRRPPGRSRLVSPLLARTRAATGRVNLAAEVPGLLRVDAAMIDRLNTIDELLTIGTLPDYAVVAPKDLVATVKIIPFSVPGNVLAVAEALVRQAGSPLDAAPVPSPEGRPGRHRAARPEGQRHREDHRRDRAAGDPADRLAAAAAALAARGSADRQGAGIADFAGRRSAAGRRRLGGGGPARRRPRGHRAGRRRDPAFRHAGGPRQPDLPRPYRHDAGAGPARLRAQPEAERHRLRADPAVRRPAGRPDRGHEDGRRRAAEGDRHAAAAAREGARARRAPAPPRAARRPSPPSCWPPGGRAAWRRTTSCWSPTAPASR